LPAPAAAKVAIAVLRTRRGRRLLLVLLGGAALGFSTVVIVLLSAVNAVVSRCEASASATPTGRGPVYVSQEPSGEALADIPADYLAIYREAGEDYGLDWAVLAAVGKIETDHGRLDAPGVASGENPSGAGGPMQFLASTWANVGVDGNGDGVKDRYDPEDAIPGAANYLKLEGAPEDYGSALLAYNHSQAYVDDVLAQAEEYRAAADEQGGEMASSEERPPLAVLLSPLGARPAHAAEGETAAGTVGDPGETSYSSLEVETLGLINGYREENGLEPLLLSDLVSTAAARYAHDMAKYDAYGVPEAHVTGPSDYYPEGADLTARMNAEGYRASGYGENIAAGQGTSRGVFEAWRSSPPHDAMMLSPEMRVIGIGLVENPETSFEEFWVTDFGNEENETSRPVPEAGSGPAGEDAGATVEEEAAPVAPGPPSASLPEHCDPFVEVGLVRLAARPGGGGQTTAPEPGAGSATGKEVVEEAEKYLGTPYVLGGLEVCEPGVQMDCTCLTTTVFRRFGYELPDMPTALMDYGEPVEGPPQAGDVHVWGDPGDGTGGHVAIEVGNGQIVHANMGTMDTSVTPMWDSPNYLGARRLVE